MTRLAPRLAPRAALVRGAAIAGVAVVALAGCATAESDDAAPAPTSTAPAPTPDEPAPAVFTLPDDCAELIGPDLDAEYAANGVILFSDSDGNGIYEQEESVGQVGGDPFYCVYGQDGVDLSSFEFAAQALAEDGREQLLAELGALGLDESADGDRVIFSQEGDEGTLPAIVHIVLPDGWVTVNSTFGGPDRFAEATDWAEIAVEQLYPAP